MQFDILVLEFGKLLIFEFNVLSQLSNFAEILLFLIFVIKKLGLLVHVLLSLIESLSQILVNNSLQHGYLSIFYKQLLLAHLQLPDHLLPFQTALLTIDLVIGISDRSP